MARRARFPNSRSHFLTKRAGRFHLPWLQRTPRGCVEKPTTFVRMPKTATGMRQDGAPPTSDEINPSNRHSHYI